jgi:hypothetical protein
MIDREHRSVVAHQTELLALSRSTFILRACGFLYLVAVMN